MIKAYNEYSGREHAWFHGVSLTFDRITRVAAHGLRGLYNE